MVEKIRDGVPVFLRNWLPTLLACVAGAMWAGRMDARMTDLSEIVRQHSYSESLHMPYEKKVANFVTRAEWLGGEARAVENEARQRRILETLARIEEQMKAIQREIEKR